MTVLFGALGTTTALTADAARELMDRMGRRAGVTATPLPSKAAMTTIATDGMAFGVCEHERPGEARPAPTARGPHLWLALHGRLDNRAELAAMLDLPAPDCSETSDVALVLAAYQRFGVDCVQHLFGDWVFALWDAARQRMVLARDATGNSALYWWQGGGQMLFATSLPTLLAAGTVPTRPDPRWVAGLLTVFYDPARPDATAFEAVHAVPPGHLLLATTAGPQLKRWWLPEALPPIDDLPTADLEQRFLSLYDDAVRTRLRRSGGRVAATLSGGLDSGSVVALAAPALAEQRQRLLAFVHKPLFAAGDEHAGRTTDEWPLAQATACHVGNVEAIACTAADTTPVAAIRHWLDVAAVPSHAASNWYWIQDIAARAAVAGARVLLTGQGGNATVSYTGTGNLWPQLLGRRWVAVWRELQDEEAGWPTAMRERLIKPALRPLWHRLRQLSHSMREGPPWADYSLAAPALVQAADLLVHMRDARHDPGFVLRSAAMMTRFRLGLHGGADNGTAGWAELGARHGLQVADPTRDRRLVELCWRLPDAMFWSYGRQRGLIRHCMRTRLPPVVLNSVHKGLQSADLRRRLQACRQDLLDEVDTLSRHPLARHWLDMRRLALSVDAVLGGSPRSVAGAVPAAHLMRSLSAAMFLARNG